MKFREWIQTPVATSDIWTRCLDPTGNDKDKYTYAPWYCGKSQTLKYIA